MDRELYWKDEITDLRNRAAAVLVAPVTGTETVTARQAAAILSGICGLIARRWTVDEMQYTCAQLARHEPFELGRVPTDRTGRVPEPMQLLVVVSRSLLPLCGEHNLRAALAFWASESDPAVWNAVAA